MNFDKLLVELGAILDFTRKKRLTLMRIQVEFNVCFYIATPRLIMLKLTFLSIKYFSIRPLQKWKLFIFLGLIWPGKLPQFDLFRIWKGKQIDFLKNSVKRHYMWLFKFLNNSEFF